MSIGASKHRTTALPDHVAPRQGDRAEPLSSLDMLTLSSRTKDSNKNTKIDSDAQLERRGDTAQWPERMTPNSTFEPVLVPKRAGRISDGRGDMIISPVPERIPPS
ncbi:hypothetical protein [Nonomuraea turcica]|uniref:hypothetical protein n=1 Tax=Nonomuraea sp. G32 TaxID=3067274 RepID=UPI00273B22C8|nr:hypothetical protein [Nonomuraea sp. G32]MDP4510120.1 hypothetical protein [Nonomuraea sp. G32]